MPYGRITPKQQEILDYIKNEILNRGFPPAVREICEAVNLKSTSSVHSHLEALEKNGYIRRDATKPRAIEIIDDNFNLVRREVVNVPIIGMWQPDSHFWQSRILKAISLSLQSLCLIHRAFC